MKTPRVAIVRQADLYEMQIQREAEALVRAGCDVEVLVMRNPDRPREIELNGVRVTSLPIRLDRSAPGGYLTGYAGFLLMAAATLAVRCLRRRYAVVQVNTMPDFLVFAALIPKLLGSRVFIYMHEPMPELAETLKGPGRTSRALAWIEQRCLRFADHAYAVTEQLKQRYIERGADGERITVVLNGVDPAARLGDSRPADPATHDGFTLVCHGTIEDRYGQDTLVDAIALLGDDLPDLRVVITGRGSTEPEIRAQIAEHGLQDRIAFEGWVTEERLNELLHTSDAGLVGQKASPYSHLVHTNKMVDYWIFGLPVIASRLRALAETYDDSVIEYYEAGDPADLARAIRHLHDSPERCAELARNGQLAQERNGWGVQRIAYLAPYQALALGGRDAPSSSVLAGLDTSPTARTHAPATGP